MHDLTAYCVEFVATKERQVVRNCYCIGRNYAAHARELGNEIPAAPIVFLKSVAALRGLQAGPLAYPDETFHHEAELVLLIGKTVELGSQAGWECVQAVGLGLDLTRRGVQDQLKAQGLPWTAAKSFAGSGLLGAFVDLDKIADKNHIEFSFSVNGELRQSGDSRLMLNPVPVLLTHLSAAQPLMAGDLIYTGTPAGVGPLRRGDRFELRFTQLQETFPGVL